MHSILRLIKKILKNIIPFWLGVKIRGWWQIIMSWYYYGNKQHCPYCQKNFRTFLPGGEKHDIIPRLDIIGAGYRKNMLCPRCYSTDRDRLLYLYFNSKPTIFTNNIKILHIAPEGSLKAWLTKKASIQYQLGDKYAEGYTDYYYSREIPEMDLTQLPFEDNRFDIFICNHVLEHIVDDQQALKEIYRTMKPGGLAILQVPIGHRLEKTYEDNSITSPAGRADHFGQFYGKLHLKYGVAFLTLTDRK
ncbi:MAG: SAM-dependent methyltransferase [Bacteroidetes bacterium HGW-Bacteroidetes-22]|nr:MAG: SAM-dependent methyltransferase [Bacteroidetes bacterium HGW-Bacteroidetes-22]